MPERRFKALQRFDSEVVQGKGSWVEIRNPNWDDIEAISGGGVDTEQLTELEMGKKLLERSVTAWNWVDDDGDPMPEPTPELVRALPMQELIFLYNCINIEDFDPKKLAIVSSNHSKPTARSRRRSSTRN